MHTHVRIMYLTARIDRSRPRRQRRRTNAWAVYLPIFHQAFLSPTGAGVGLLPPTFKVLVTAAPEIAAAAHGTGSADINPYLKSATDLGRLFSSGNNAQSIAARIDGLNFPAASLEAEGIPSALMRAGASIGFAPVTVQ